MDKKLCSICKTIFPLSEEHFYKDHSKSCGFTSACKNCRKDQSKKNYHKNKHPKIAEPETRLLNCNHKALERLIGKFKDKDKLSASLKLEDSPESITDGLSFYQAANGEGRVRIVTTSGIHVKRLPLISVEYLNHFISSHQLRICSEAE